MSAIFAPSLRLASRNFVWQVAVFLIFLLFALHAFAGQVSLAWDASPDSRVTGYNLHYGLQSGTYTSTFSAGSATSATVTGLTEGNTYYFVVRARDAAGTESANSNQVSKTIPAAPPVASISATPTSGTAPLAVAFSSTVTGATSYTWNFGDNATSTNVQNPSHTYTAAGTYSARLTATGAGGTVTSNTQTITVTASNSGSGGSSGSSATAPQGTITSPSGCTAVAVGTRVQFVGSGSGAALPLTYSWNFGDGGTSTSQSPRRRFYTAGTYQVTLIVRDANGLADPTPATVTVVVGGSASSCTSTSTPPVAAADSYTVQSGKTLTVAAPGVLGNDTSSSGKSLSASLVTNVSSGTLSLASNGGFTYTPASGFTGNATFSYKASDGTTSSTAANVTIAVTAAATGTSSGLVAAYSFSEGTGTTVNDSSGKGNKGTITNAAWTNSGRFGKALSFNGTNAWVTVPDSSSLDLTSGMTLEAWVYPQGSLGGWRTIVMKEGSGSDVYYIETVDGKVVGDALVGGSNYHIYSDSAIPLNTWTHLAATYDGAYIRIYVNGSLATVQHSLTGSIATSGSPLRIGGNSLWGEYFQGLIDEVRVYNRALSAAEIATDMNAAVTVASTTTPSTELVAAYGFNEGTGRTVNDQSGMGNKGTISNATWTNSGRFGKALSFNGTNAWVTVPDSDSLDVTTGVTLEAWVYPKVSLDGWRTIVMKEQPGSDVYYLETVDGKQVGDVFAGGRNHHIYSDSAIPLYTWTHVATTYDGTSQRIYINGNEAAAYQRSLGPIETSDGALRIGGNSIWGEYFQGNIDEVRVYDRALSQSEIQSDMNKSI